MWLSGRGEFNVNSDDISLAIGSSFRIEITRSGNIENNTDFSWISQDSSIATVTEHGLITAVGIGETVITITQNNNYREIRVRTRLDAIDNIRFEQNSITLSEREEILLTPIINDNPAIQINLSWQSNDYNVVSVDGSGRITAHGPGTAVITVAEDSSGVRASITVIVEAIEIP